MTWVDELAACPLAAGPFPRDARRCDWCGADLPKRRTRWCSDDHADAYSRNHAWTSARAAALARDGHRCTRCGSDGVHRAEYWYAFMVYLCGRYPRGRPRRADWCRAHGWLAAESNEAIDAYLDWVRRTSRRWDQAARIAIDAHRLTGLEVNHVTPCLGQHKANSCAHHLDGLEVLCHPCHLKETARQRRAGLLERSA